MDKVIKKIKYKDLMYVINCEDSENNAEYGRFFVNFFKKSKLIGREFVGESKIINFKCLNYKIIPNNRMQICCMCKDKVSYTKVYDFDGTRIRELYDLSRTGAESIGVILDNRFIIVEDWRKDFFMRENYMGVGLDDGDGMVVRFLVWEKLRFENIMPGKTITSKNIKSFPQYIRRFLKFDRMTLRPEQTSRCLPVAESI